MKLTKIIALPILLSMQFVALSGVVRAQEVNNLQNLCSKFSSNSKCKTYKFFENISFNTHSGKKTQCLLSGDKKGKDYKFDMTHGLVKSYSETGKRLDILEGEKDTKGVFVPTQTIKYLSYSEKQRFIFVKYLLLECGNYLQR